MIPLTVVPLPSLPRIGIVIAVAWVGMGVCDTLHSMVPLYGVYMSTSPSDSTLYKCEVCNETFNTQQEIESHNKEKRIETAGQKE
jgi:C2H2-type zinc finger